ncbi:hypothetical protein ATCV1_z158L [Acanthocystis turfacea chlorella virus 1]|uniref:Uncharacterized protein z158L n=1 Tax=Chlorovirus heliozoae TaxID=322019 RepID=A7K8B8_9PHYC|nr:hypothetical protein ATCV1_z158L [Acanthocystis turfacea chlorella virus 1]ABT16292.1 hypothetical protein ATCV1_z158L [Acanthocystis turfacea chlorella virus 1]
MTAQFLIFFSSSIWQSARFFVPGSTPIIILRCCYIIFTKIMRITRKFVPRSTGLVHKPCSGSHTRG